MNNTRGILIIVLEVGLVIFEATKKLTSILSKNKQKR